METQQKSKTISEQLLIAEGIFKHVLAANVPIDNQDACAKLLKQLADEYRDFYISHPLVVRYMCQLRAYDSGAFAGYLKAISKNPAVILKVKGFLEAQADYAIRLLRAVTPGGITGKDARERKKQITEVLIKEYEDLQKKYTDARAATDVKNEELTKAAQKEFKKAISAGVSGIGTIRVESEEPLSEPKKQIYPDTSVERFGGADEFL